MENSYFGSKWTELGINTDKCVGFMTRIRLLGFLRGMGSARIFMKRENNEGVYA